MRMRIARLRTGRSRVEGGSRFLLSDAMRCIRFRSMSMLPSTLPLFSYILLSNMFYSTQNRVFGNGVD